MKDGVKKKKTTPLTPKWAAMLLLQDWFLCGPDPWMMEQEEMTKKFLDHGYTVTDRRYEEIIAQLNDITRPWRKHLDEELKNTGLL